MRSAEILGDKFIQRWDVRAEQQEDGSYLCIREPLRHTDIKGHVLGDKTLGAYVLNENGHARYMVFDVDNEVDYHKMFIVADRLAMEGIPSYMESSRRGGHLWLFMETTISGQAAIRFGEGIAAKHGLDVEIFPKTVTDNVGSMIRLPFGIHRKSGKRYPFVNIEDGLPIAPTVRQQLNKLREADKVSLADIKRYMEIVPPKPAHSENEESGDVFAYVSQFVELRPTRSGGIGHCPFHDDEHVSFSVNRQGNYWNCFAGCGGGRIEQFRAKWDSIIGGQE